MAVTRPLSVYETYQRSLKGSKLDEKEWDYKVIPQNATALKEKYKLHFGREFVPTDKETKERLFLAGMEMLVMTGIYNADTHRIVKVTEEEVRECLKKAPRSLVMGSGKDAADFSARKGNSKKKPVIQGGPTGAPVSEEMFIPLIQSFAQEAVVDTIVSGVMQTIEGVTVQTNTPWEIKATQAEIRAIREACRRAGRPGMGI